MTELPAPECTGGYTDDQLRDLLGDRYAEFRRWMYGQTQMVCDGQRFNHDTGRYEPSSCGSPHGIVTYSCDVRAFLDGRAPLD